MALTAAVVGLGLGHHLISFASPARWRVSSQFTEVMEQVNLLDASTARHRTNVATSPTGGIPFDGGPM